MKRAVAFAIIIAITFMLSACSTDIQTKQTDLTALAPVIKSVKMLDENSNPLQKTGNWINLQTKNKIRVEFEGPATHVDFYTMPAGTETYAYQKCIGTVDIADGADYAELSWAPPECFMGYIWVLVYNKDVARTSQFSNEFFITAICE